MTVIVRRRFGANWLNREEISRDVVAFRAANALSRWGTARHGQPWSQPVPRPCPASDLIDITAVAQRLGVQVRHVRRLVHERRIPYIKWGNLLRFDPNEIEAWLDRARFAESARRTGT